MELKSVVKYCMVLIKLSCKSYELEHKSRKMSRKSTSCRLNKSEKQVLKNYNRCDTNKFWISLVFSRPISRPEKLGVQQILNRFGFGTKILGIWFGFGLKWPKPKGFGKIQCQQQRSTLLGARYNQKKILARRPNSNPKLLLWLCCTPSKVNCCWWLCILPNPLGFGSFEAKSKPNPQSQNKSKSNLKSKANDTKFQGFGFVASLRKIKITGTGTGTNKKNLPGPGPKKKLHRDRARDQRIFTGTGTGTGTEKKSFTGTEKTWSRTCLLGTHMLVDRTWNSESIGSENVFY